jgi:transposase
VSDLREDWALIRRLVADGVSKRQVARDLGISRATVDRAVALDRPPKYERAAVATSFTPFEARVRALLAEHPKMSASLVAERVGWTGSVVAAERRRATPVLPPGGSSGSDRLVCWRRGAV